MAGTEAASSLGWARVPASASERSAAAARALSEVDPHLVSLTDPASFGAEQYSVVRQQIEQLHRDTGLRVVAVTSPTPGDGKTTTAINLAGALARTPTARVLLMDTDLRHPSVGMRLGLDESQAPGLVNAVREPGLSLGLVARERSPFKLSVLPAGAAPELPFELLRSPRVGVLLEEARQAYDFVVLDTSPALLAPDCRVLEKWVDGFLVVVSAHRTPRRLLAETLTHMDPAKVIAIVFNQDDRPLAGYYKRYYGYAQRGSNLLAARSGRR
jgi:capsular exopolysaccharide synthesis family protein